MPGAHSHQIETQFPITVRTKKINLQPLSHLLSLSPLICMHIYSTKFRIASRLRYGKFVPHNLVFLSTGAIFELLEQSYAFQHGILPCCFFTSLLFSFGSENSAVVYDSL